MQRQNIAILGGGGGGGRSNGTLGNKEEGRLGGGREEGEKQIKTQLTP